VWGAGVDTVREWVRAGAKCVDDVRSAEWRRAHAVVVSAPIEAALYHYHDLQKRLPRDTVETGVRLLCVCARACWCERVRARSVANAINAVVQQVTTESLSAVHTTAGAAATSRIPTSTLLRTTSPRRRLNCALEMHVAGSYRRGAATSGDVDLVFTPVVCDLYVCTRCDHTAVDER
jgi:hypothetical protein